jgi:hypothetical protein
MRHTVETALHHILCEKYFIFNNKKQLVYDLICGGRGGGGGCGVSANEYSCAHGAQIKFGDLNR